MHIPLNQTTAGGNPQFCKKTSDKITAQFINRRSLCILGYIYCKLILLSWIPLLVLGEILFAWFVIVVIFIWVPASQLQLKLYSMKPNKSTERDLFPAWQARCSFVSPTWWCTAQVCTDRVAYADWFGGLCVLETRFCNPVLSIPYQLSRKQIGSKLCSNPSYTRFHVNRLGACARSRAASWFIHLVGRLSEDNTWLS